MTPGTKGTPATAGTPEKEGAPETAEMLIIAWMPANIRDASDGSEACNSRDDRSKRDACDGMDALLMQ
jgi:hypothetical protein